MESRFNVLAAIAQLVEHRLPKPRVTGSSPACRSRFPDSLVGDFLFCKKCDIYRGALFRCVCYLEFYSSAIHYVFMANLIVIVCFAVECD